MTSVGIIQARNIGDTEISVPKWSEGVRLSTKYVLMTKGMNSEQRNPAYSLS